MSQAWIFKTTARLVAVEDGSLVTVKTTLWGCWRSHNRRVVKTLLNHPCPIVRNLRGARRPWMSSKRPKTRTETLLWFKTTSFRSNPKPPKTKSWIRRRLRPWITRWNSQKIARINQHLWIFNKTSPKFMELPRWTKSLQAYRQSKRWSLASRKCSSLFRISLSSRTTLLMRLPDNSRRAIMISTTGRSKMTRINSIKRRSKISFRSIPLLNQRVLSSKNPSRANMKNHISCLCVRILMKTLNHA